MHYDEHTERYPEVEDLANRHSYNCDWVTYRSQNARESSLEVCVHDMKDIISASVKKHGHWGERDELSLLWAKRQSKSLDTVFLDIGGNIGSCVWEQLLATEAKVIVFEPHPRNQFCIISTLSRMPSSIRKRVVVVPVGLGNETSTATIKSMVGNMGHSTIGAQNEWAAKAVGYDEKEKHTIHVERLDNMLKPSVKVGLVKLDVEGFECRVLEGMGVQIPGRIDRVKFEYSRKLLHPVGCTNLLQRFEGLGLELYYKEDVVEAATFQPREQFGNLIAVPKGTVAE